MNRGKTATAAGGGFQFNAHTIFRNRAKDVTPLAEWIFTYRFPVPCTYLTICTVFQWLFSWNKWFEFSSYQTRLFFFHFCQAIYSLIHVSSVESVSLWNIVWINISFIYDNILNSPVMNNLPYHICSYETPSLAHRMHQSVLPRNSFSCLV